MSLFFFNITAYSINPSCIISNLSNFDSDLILIFSFYLLQPLRYRPQCSRYPEPYTGVRRQAQNREQITKRTVETGRDVTVDFGVLSTPADESQRKYVNIFTVTPHADLHQHYRRVQFRSGSESIFNVHSEQCKIRSLGQGRKTTPRL